MTSGALEWGWWGDSAVRRPAQAHDNDVSKHRELTGELSETFRVAVEVPRVESVKVA